MRTTSNSYASTSALQQLTGLFLVVSLVASTSAVPLTRRCATSTINYTTGQCNPIRFARFLQTGSLANSNFPSKEIGTLIPKYSKGYSGGRIKNESECYAACVKIGVDFNSIQWTSSSSGSSSSSSSDGLDEIDDSNCYCKHSLESYGPLRIDFKGTVSLFEGDCLTLSQNPFLKGVECQDVMIKVGDDFTREYFFSSD